MIAGSQDWWNGTEIGFLKVVFASDSGYNSVVVLRSSETGSVVVGGMRTGAVTGSCNELQLIMLVSSSCS